MCENILSIYAYICWVYAVRPGVGSKLSEYMERAQIKRGGNAVLGILYKFVFTLFFFLLFFLSFHSQSVAVFSVSFLLLLFLYWHPAVGQRSKLASAFASVCAVVCFCVCVCVRTEIAISICSFLLFFIFVESKTPPHVVPPSPAPAATNWKLWLVASSAKNNVERVSTACVSVSVCVCGC